MNFVETSGKDFSIFSPSLKYHGMLYQFHRPIISSPSVLITYFKNVVEQNNKILLRPLTNSLSVARHTYLQFLANMISAMAFEGAEFSVVPALGKLPDVTNFNKTLRINGLDWTYFGVSMTGLKRLISLKSLLLNVIRSAVPGVFIETGVWRGGSSILAQGVLKAYKDSRKVVLCDSFTGLPPGKTFFSVSDVGWDNTTYLEVSEVDVAANFNRYHLLDSNIIFVKGFFNNSMSKLRNQIRKISILRLDGDMYQSTVDVLYHLYDKVSIGGYIVVDDWFGFPAKDACEDFFKTHRFSPTIKQIDQWSIYWEKTQDIVLQFWRYKNKTFKV